MGRGQLTPAGAPCGDSCSSGVTECLSACGLGLNSHLASLLENVCHSSQGRVEWWSGEAGVRISGKSSPPLEKQLQVHDSLASEV